MANEPGRWVTQPGRWVQQGYPAGVGWLANHVRETLMRRILIVPVIAGIVLLTGACGAKEETTTTQPTLSSSSGDADPTSTAATDDSTEDQGGGDDSGGGGGIGDVPGLSSECAAVSTLYAGAMAQAGAVFDPTGSTAEELEKLADDFEQAKDDVPAEIADAFETWSSAWTQYVEVLGGMSEGGMTNPANLEKLQEASEVLESPEVEAAGKEIEAFLREQCSGVTGLVPEN